MSTKTTIKYNEEIIASFGPGQTATLECAGGKMLSNIEVAVPDSYIIPEGTLEIVTNGTYDVTNTANVLVNIPAVEIPEYDGAVTIREPKEVTIIGTGSAISLYCYADKPLSEIEGPEDLHVDDVNASATGVLTATDHIWVRPWQAFYATEVLNCTATAYYRDGGIVDPQPTKDTFDILYLITDIQEGASVTFYTDD